VSLSLMANIGPYGALVRGSGGHSWVVGLWSGRGPAKEGEQTIFQPQSGEGAVSEDREAEEGAGIEGYEGV